MDSNGHRFSLRCLNCNFRKNILGIRVFKNICCKCCNIKLFLMKLIISSFFFVIKLHLGQVCKERFYFFNQSTYLNTRIRIKHLFCQICNKNNFFSWEQKYVLVIIIKINIQGMHSNILRAEYLINSIWKQKNYYNTLYYIYVNIHLFKYFIVLDLKSIL